jgi:hypothetical protein
VAVSCRICQHRQQFASSTGRLFQCNQNHAEIPVTHNSSFDLVQLRPQTCQPGRSRVLLPSVSDSGVIALETWPAAGMLILNNIAWSKHRLFENAAPL